MGLFFHELDTDFQKYGTDYWNKQQSFSQSCILQGEFMELIRSKKSRKRLQFCLTKEKIYLTTQKDFRSLDLCLTALEEHFYLENGKKVYELRLMKDDLLTTLCTNDEQVFIDFYCFMAKFCILKNFERHFRVSKKLGQGSFSVVYQGRSIYSNTQVALKVFDKKKLLQTPDGFEILKNQITNLQKLKNFGLSPLIETYQTEDCIILVLKKAQCGHMIDYIKQHTQEYDEKMARKIMKKVFENLYALHSAGFIHRDIKPENILFDCHQNSFQLFLADFGLTVEKNTPRNSIGNKCSGTLGFVAPQTLHGNDYDEKCDIFSAGCLLYFLLSGKSIFSGMSIEEIMKLTEDNNYIIRKLSKIPVELGLAKQLLKSLLKIDPKERISAQQALSFQFFEDQKGSQDKLLTKLYGQDADETIRSFITKKIKNFWK